MKADRDSIHLSNKHSVINENPDISYSLDGNTPGVYVKKTSSTFGTAPRITIRGNVSFIGDGRPLWIIDGVKQADLININQNELNIGNLIDVFSSSVAGINPEDIESIEILKDISATAIFGVDGANGVILVTTRKGKSGKLSVNYRGSFTINRKPNISDFNILDSKSEMDIYNDLIDRGWLSLQDLNIAKDYGVIGKYIEAVNTFDGTSWLADYSAEGRAKFLEPYINANTDWFDELFNNNITQQHSFDISGGNDKTSFYTSFSHYRDNGYAIGYETKRNTINANIQHNFNDKLKVGAKLMSNWRDQQTPGVNDAEYLENGTYLRRLEINPFLYALTTSRSMRARDENGELEFFRKNYASFNIINEIRNNYADISVKDISAQINLDYQIFKKLSFHSNVLYRNANTESNHTVTTNSNLVASYLNVENIPEGEVCYGIDREMTNFNIRNFIKWNPILNGLQRLDITLGHEISDINRKIDDETKSEIENYSGPFPVNASRDNDFRQLSYFVDINYSLRDKYFFHGSMRSDKSDYNYIEDKALPSWQFSARWNMKEEAFLKKSSIINYLSPKLSYGKTHLLPDQLNSDYIIPQEFAQMNLNQEFTTGKMNELNMALEFGLFANCLNGELAYYKRKSDDLISLYRTSGVGGMALKYANEGEIKSRGFEVNLNSINVKTKNFSWRSNLNISTYKSEVKRANNSITIAEATSYGASFKGKPHRALYSVKFAGLDKNGIPTFYGRNNEVINYLSLYDTNDIESVLKYEGPVNPKVYGGFSNGFKYRNLTLKIGLTYAFGNVVRVNNNYKANYNDTQSFQNSFNNRWVLTGDEEHTYIPAIVSRWMFENGSQAPYELDNLYDLYNLSTEATAKGDFIRLNNIQLSYQIPKNIIERFDLKSASLSVQANNICLLYSDSKLNGIDPEYELVGGVSLPVPKSYTFTLKLGF
ncbi:SusC/RagA family TonB-linked outer membrane protein [Ancylomarina salipaludis]|nr:SusC/RagA family TonB-linked outer membrane protein [Ancylomarina salipaludis]